MRTRAAMWPERVVGGPREFHVNIRDKRLAIYVKYQEYYEDPTP